MDTTFIPSPLDDGQKMEAAITKTATFVGTTFDNGASFAPGGIGLHVAAVLDVGTFALGGSTGASTWTAQMEESANDSTWNAIGPVVTVSAAAVISIPGTLSKRYSRVHLYCTGATGTGTLGLTAWQTPLGRAI